MLSVLQRERGLKSTMDLSNINLLSLLRHSEKLNSQLGAKLQLISRNSSTFSSLLPWKWGRGLQAVLQMVALLHKLLHLQTTILEMFMDIQDIRNRVAEQTAVITSAKTLLESLHQRLDEAIKAEDPAALQALADDIQANTTSLAAAVQENTPAAPTPTPAPPVQP